MSPCILRKVSLFAIILLAASSPSRAQQATLSPPTLLDRLAGDWVLQGRLGKNQSTHDIRAQWILNHEYMQLHEVSREKDANGKPAYEALITFAWDEKRGEYVCLWLDSTEGGGLSLPMAHGKPSGLSIPVVWTFTPSHSMHTTFMYNEQAQTWKVTIDDVEGSKSDRFGDVVLRKMNSP